MLKQHPTTAILFALIITFISNIIHAKPSLVDYGSLPNVSYMAISPSGDKVAYRQTQEQIDRIVVISLRKEKLIGGVVLTGGLDPQQIYFVNENELVLKVSKHARISGYLGKHNISSAYVYNLKSNKIKELLESGQPVYPGQSDLGNVVGMSPDKKYIYMAAYIGSRGMEGDPNYGVFRVKLSQTSIRRVHYRGHLHSRFFLTNKKGEVFVDERYDNRKNVHSIHTKIGKKWSEIYTEATTVPSIDIVGTTDDYKHIIVSRENAAGFLSYYKMDVKTGEISEPLFSSTDSDVDYVLTNINGVVFGARLSGFNPHYQFLDSKLQKRIASLIKQFDGNSLFITDWTGDWSTLVTLVEGSAFSGQYYAIKEEGAPILLTSRRENIKSDDVNPIAIYQYTAEDGTNIPTLLTIPQHALASMKNLPAIMLPHGGPAAYDQIGFDWLAQALASEGYLVIQPQFRGSEGFGSEHYLKGRGEWGKKMQTDLSDGINALVKKGMIDPNKLCIVGISYGGYAALAAGAFTPKLYQCIVSINGVSDIPRMLDKEKYDYGKDHWVVSYFERSMIDSKPNNHLLESISPVEHVNQFSSPVLLIHGENDEVVDVSQAKVMHRSLMRSKKSSQLILLKNEGHHLSKSKSRIQALKETVAFINKHLKPIQTNK